jgi:hypothetical protein
MTLTANYKIIKIYVVILFFSSYERKVKGDIEVTGRRGRKRRKLLDGLEERKDTII